MNFGLAGDQESLRTWSARHAMPLQTGHCDRAAVNLNAVDVSALFDTGKVRMFLMQQLHVAEMTTP